MPQQQQTRVSQPGADASSRTAQDDDIDQAVAAAVEEAANSTVVDDAADWLDTIDEALDEWAATSELAQAFVASYIQKGGE